MIRRSSSFNADCIDHLYQDPQEEPRRLFISATAIDAERVRELVRPLRNTTCGRYLLSLVAA
jgi:hypothetical protein